MDRATGGQLSSEGSNHLYAPDLSYIESRFSEWDRLFLIQGRSPGILGQLPSHKIAFLHIDLNSPSAEIASLSNLWDKLVPGAFILFDDYSYMGCEDLSLALDQFLKDKDTRVLGLPTGQGLLLR